MIILLSAYLYRFQPDNIFRSAMLATLVSQHFSTVMMMLMNDFLLQLYSVMHPTRMPVQPRHLSMLHWILLYLS